MTLTLTSCEKIYWHVYDNEKPAKWPECPVHSSWDNNKFESRKEAETYANKWLGGWGPAEFDADGKFEYGHGDIISIRFGERR